MLFRSEEKSLTTKENALFTRQILEKEGINKIILVTNEWHMQRAKLLFEGQGFQVLPASVGEGVSTLVKLLPNDKTLLKYVSEIHLYFDVDSVVERVKLIEPSKDYTEILFSNKKLNTKIDEANFKM